MERTCSSCSKTFTVERKRGRPHTKCESCRKIPKTNPCLEIPTPKLGPGELRPKKKEKKFKDEPTKGNPRYSRQAFIDYVDTYGVPIGAQAVAKAIRIVKEG